MRVFVSYRREDSIARAGRLRDGLADRFGSGNVFHDVSTIAPGMDFEAAIATALASADAVLVVIGPGWLDPGADHTVRLDEPDDYVRLEVTGALEAGVPVVPVLVGGASMPTADQLPEALRALTRRQYVVLRDERWPEDLADLVDELRGSRRTDRSARRRRRLAAAAAGAAVVVVAVLAVVVLSQPDGSDGSTNPPPACERPDGAGWTRLAGPDADATGIVDVATGSVEFSVSDAFSRPTSSGWDVVLDTIVVNRGEERYVDWFAFARLDVAGFAFAPASCFSIASDPVEADTAARARVGFAVTEDPRADLRLVVTQDETSVTIDVTTASSSDDG